MKSIIATQGKVKIYVKINRYGQPCGLKTCNFTNFIASLVKGGDLSLMHKDWRMVKDKKKIWTLVNVIARNPCDYFFIFICCLYHVIRVLMLVI